MSRIYDLEPLVMEALTNEPRTRGDNFLLYLAVLNKFIDTDMSIKDVFENHVHLGIPALESITRCRRKLQERDPALKDEKAVEAREKEKADYIDYALGDKQIH